MASDDNLNMWFLRAGGVVEVARLNAQVAMFQIARNTYFQQLKDAVAQSPIPLGSDTIKLG